MHKTSAPTVTVFYPFHPLAGQTLRCLRTRSEPAPAVHLVVCLHDHHPAFITWDQFLANRRRINENRPRWIMHQNDGAIREGLALLPGLLRCARCGSKIRVGYKKQAALYHCDGGAEKGSKRCFSFGSTVPRPSTIRSARSCAARSRHTPSKPRCRLSP